MYLVAALNCCQKSASLVRSQSQPALTSPLRGIPSTREGGREGGQPLISVIGRAASAASVAAAAGRRGDGGGDLRLRRRHIADLSYR